MHRDGKKLCYLYTYINFKTSQKAIIRCCQVWTASWPQVRAAGEFTDPPLHKNVKTLSKRESRLCMSTVLMDSWFFHSLHHQLVVSASEHLHMWHHCQANKKKWPKNTWMSFLLISWHAGKCYCNCTLEQWLCLAQNITFSVWSSKDMTDMAGLHTCMINKTQVISTLLDKVQFWSNKTSCPALGHTTIWNL